MSTHVRIQEVVHKYVRFEGKSITCLCEELGWPRQKWYDFRNTDIITVQDLYALSQLLNHDFFLDCSQMFFPPKESTSS